MRKKGIQAYYYCVAGFASYFLGHVSFFLSFECKRKVLFATLKSICIFKLSTEESTMMKKKDITRHFIDKVNSLIERRILRNRRELVDILNWNESSLSNVMAGRRPVPEDIAERLFKLYNFDKPDPPLPILQEGTPVYELTATAGQMDNINQVPEVPAFHVNVPGYEDCNFGMYVYGHSMYPTIENGSLILCRRIFDKDVLMYGEIYLIRTHDYLIVKRIQKSDKKNCILCTSDNFEQRSEKYRRFEPFDLDKDKILDLYLIKGIIKKTQS